MRSRTGLALAAAGALATLALLAAPGAAEPPEDAGWGSLTLEGAPVDAGFLDDGDGDGALVYATTSSDSVPGAEGGACSLEAETPDLYLVSFPEEPGCLDVLDTSEQTEGVEALATAEAGDAALVGLPIDGAGTLSDDNLVRYERNGDNLTEMWRAPINGAILDLAVDDEGDRGAVTFRTENGNHRLTVLSSSGATQLNVALPGEPRSLTVADNARYVAVGGNETTDGQSIGWAHLYDLSEDGSDPVIERTIPRPRAGIVTSVAVTDEGQTFAGLFDGTARWLRPSADDEELSLATDAVHLDVDSDGETLFAAAGNETARITVDREDATFETRWLNRVNGTAEAAVVRTPHLFAVAETVNGLSSAGDDLWEITAGSVVAFNETGLGAGVASETDEGGATSERSSVLSGRVLHRNLSLEQADPITVTPGGVARGNVTFHNQGAAILQLTPVVAADGLQARAQPETPTLLPGERTEVTFTVEAVSDAAPGDRSVPVDLQAEPGVATEATIAVEVTSRPNVSLELAEGEVSDRDVTQGQTVNVRLDLRNRGNAEATVSLNLLQTVDDPWPSRVAPNETVTVPASSLTTARVEIDVPAGVPDGTENRVILSGESEQGASAVQVNLTVNPFQVVRIRPDTISQQMAPGATTPYDFTVENLGSVEADVRLRLQPLDADGEPCLPTAWGLTPGASRVTVPAQGSQPVRVEVTAPAEVPVPEVENGTAGCTDDAQRPSLRVELQGVSDDGSRDSSVLFANVDPALADDEQPEQNREPAPGLALVAAVLAGAAVLARGAKP
jgi:hypothetical protein